MKLEIIGNGVKNYFSKEIGGHRWQRVPPTEKSGRVHTSTVKVVIVEKYENDVSVEINEKDIKKEYTRGHGKGGQHKNKVSTCVVLTHMPTGIKVRIDGRDRAKNEKEARKILTERLQKQKDDKFKTELASNIGEQIGTFRRGDKIRTYREQDNQVNDHITGKTATLKEIEKGFINLLH